MSLALWFGVGASGTLDRILPLNMRIARGHITMLVGLCLLAPRIASADITTGLVGRWAFDETAGSTASDSSGNNNNGTLINGPAWNAAGKVGGALSFDGVNDYVSLGNPSSLILGNAMTLAGWMKLTNIATTRYIISRHDGVTPQADTYIRYQATTMNQTPSWFRRSPMSSCRILAVPVTRRGSSCSAAGREDNGGT